MSVSILRIRDRTSRLTCSREWIISMVTAGGAAGALTAPRVARGVVVPRALCVDSRFTLRVAGCPDAAGSESESSCERQDSSVQNMLTREGAARSRTPGGGGGGGGKHHTAESRLCAICGVTCCQMSVTRRHAEESGGRCPPSSFAPPDPTAFQSRRSLCGRQSGAPAALPATMPTAGTARCGSAASGRP